MSRRNTILALAILAILALPLMGETIRNHFDADTAMRPPGYFDLLVWGAPGPAHWLVLADLNPRSTPDKLTQTTPNRPEGSLAVALRRTYSFSDGQVSVALRKGSGRGGLVLRAANEKDFLLLLMDVGSGEAVLSSYRGGKATELARGKADLEHDWGILSVSASGPVIEARWNGEPLLRASDPRPVAGRIGAATMGPGSVSFDELVFETAPAAAAR
jgi:hypothetical protein